MRVCTVKDVAKKAGVSAMTVSRVLNQTGSVSEALLAWHPFQGDQEKLPPHSSYICRREYLRKPRSEIGMTSFLGALPALLLTIAAFRMMVVSYGNPPLFVSAMAMSALLLSLFSLVCGALSFRERDADHRFAVLGLSIGGIVAAVWIITMIVGAAV